MDFSNPTHREVFFDVHNGLPREGPGDRLSTEKAISLVKPLPTSPAVLDIACGPGMQTLHLAEQLPQAKLTCFDLHEPMVIESRN